MNRVVILKDKRAVRIRPIAADDVERSLAFFLTLSEEDRRYLRRDVTRREVVEERIEEALLNQVDRIVVVSENRIVADGSLVPGEYRWKEGVAEIRIMVAPEFRRCGLGVRLARELYVLALKRDLARIDVRMMAPQMGSKAVFRRLGFDDEFVIPKHVRDGNGVWQDLVLMRCDLSILMESADQDADAVETPLGNEEETIPEIEALRRYAVRWAVLAAWNDDLDLRGIVVARNPSHKLEEARVLLASGCFGSCQIGLALAEIEAQLISADASTAESKADEWISLLGRAMVEPEGALKVHAVRFRHADCVGAGDGCGVAR